MFSLFFFFFFFFNDTATTEIYTLSLHDAPPIPRMGVTCITFTWLPFPIANGFVSDLPRRERSEEHTSELQSRLHLVCRLLLEKKKQSPHTRKPRLHRAQ